MEFYVKHAMCEIHFDDDPSKFYLTERRSARIYFKNLLVSKSEPVSIRFLFSSTPLCDTPDETLPSDIFVSPQTTFLLPTAIVNST